MSVPKLRFKEFKGKWEVKSLVDVCNKIIDGTHFSPKSTEGTRKYLTSKNIRNTGIDLSDCNYISEEEHKEIYKRCPVQIGDILLTKDGVNTGNCCINTLQEEFSLLSSVAVIRSKAETLNNYFLLQTLQSPYGINLINSYLAGQAIGRITLAKIKSFDFAFPTLQEQTKIADFLMAVDKKIAQLTQKCELLARYKKGVMQQIFSQELRFKDDDGRDFPDWEDKQLNQLLTESKQRNVEEIYSREDVLSVSGQYGIVNQIELQGRCFAGVSIKNYPIVETGDIVYTKSPLKTNPYGIIKVNKGKSGIVSTLYAVYKTQNTTAGLYLDYYFQLDDNVNSYLRPLVKKGAKNDMKVNNAHVLSNYIFVPTDIKEQVKIANFLTSIDEKITETQTYLDTVKQYKQGLLQQMFV
jgi:type I restriction enzyme S subunit